MSGQARAAAGARDAQRVRAQRVDALARLVLAGAQHVRRLVRPRDPARAEHDVTAPARDPAGGSCWRETPTRPAATRPRRPGAPRTGGPRPRASPSTATSAKCSPSTHHVRSRAPRISTSHAASACSQIVATRSSTYRTIGPRTRPGTAATYFTGGERGEVGLRRRAAGLGVRPVSALDAPLGSFCGRVGLLGDDERHAQAGGEQCRQTDR